VGPHKTGSTTLQAALLGALRAPLKSLDQIEVPAGIPGYHGGRKNHANIAMALMSYVPPANSTAAWRATMAQAGGAIAAGQSFLLSSEDFADVSASQLDLLMGSFRRLGFARTAVIVVYRRLYDRLLSWHSQLFLRTDAKAPTHAHVPLVDWLETADAQSRFFQTARLRDEFSPLASRMSLLNSHALQDDNSLLDEFVCRMVRAACTCARLLPRGKRARENARSRQAAHVKDLVWGAAIALGYARVSTMIAAQQGLLDEAEAPSRAGAMQIPLRCLNESALATILRATDEEESLLFPERSARERVLMTEDFDSKRHMFCSADVGKALRARKVRLWVLDALIAGNSSSSLTSPLPPTPAH
jgi:hypothetical protein